MSFLLVYFTGSLSTQANAFSITLNVRFLIKDPNVSEPAKTGQRRSANVTDTCVTDSEAEEEVKHAMDTREIIYETAPGAKRKEPSPSSSITSIGSIDDESVEKAKSQGKRKKGWAKE
ncbi:hypothetical protein FQR65_LT11653 [Abscondita terminalis]|nr:hypothetical protein FQR65_LT11653 [Abscondita terminalis]